MSYDGEYDASSPYGICRRRGHHADIVTTCADRSTMVKYQCRQCPCGAKVEHGPGCLLAQIDMDEVRRTRSDRG